MDIAVRTTRMSRRWLLIALSKSRDPLIQYACGVLTLSTRNTAFVCEEDILTNESRLFLGTEWIPIGQLLREAVNAGLLATNFRPSGGWR